MSPAAAIRAFRASDLDQIVAALALCTPRDAIDQTRFAESFLLDEGIDTSGLLIAEVDGRFAGFCLAVCPDRRLVGVPENSGWIVWLAVLPADRQQGIGGLLLDQALAWLTGRGAERIVVSGYPRAYLTPGVDEDLYPEAVRLFASRSFAVSSRPVAMRVDLAGYSVPQSVIDLQQRREAEGFRFGPASWGELPAAMRLVEDKIAPDWGDALRGVCRTDGDPHRVLLARSPRDGRPLGVATYGAYGSPLSRFGPIGVDPDARRGGLGRILMHQVCRAQQASGQDSSWFLWTDEDGPAGQMYLQAGYQIFRRFAVLAR